MKTQRQLEKLFNDSPFSSILVNKDKYQKDELMIWFLSSYEDLDLDENYLGIPIPCYLLDRYMNNSYSMINGLVVLYLRFPFEVSKNDDTLMVSPYLLPLWDLHLDGALDTFDTDVWGKITTEFLTDSVQIYPSLLTPFQKKIRFKEMWCCFDSSEESVLDLDDSQRMLSYLDELVDNDQFIQYVFDVYIPLILYFQNQICISDKAYIKLHQKLIKEVRSSL